MAAAEIVLRGGARISLVRVLPFAAVHLACLAALWVDFRWSYLLWAAAFYYIRMFFITAGYHRYFSHRSFKTSRAFQFLLAFLTMTSAQKGVLWWAGHHRNHHRFSDTEDDVHSPSRQGFWWSHVGWILSNRYDATEADVIADFHRYPELRWLNRS
ncbi:MAG: acyl-CoA desaturase, partial [Chloroflexota bacterium]